MGNQQLLTTCCITALAKRRPQLAIKGAHQFVDLARVGFVLTDLSLALLEHAITIAVPRRRQTNLDCYGRGDCFAGETTAAKALALVGAGEARLPTDC